MAQRKTVNTELIGGIVMLVLGVLLITGILDLEVILGAALIALGVLGIARAA